MVEAEATKHEPFVLQAQHIHNLVQRYRSNSERSGLLGKAAALFSKENVDKALMETISDSLTDILVMRGLIETEASEVAYFATREIYYLREFDRYKKKARKNTVTQRSPLRDRNDELKSADKEYYRYSEIIESEYGVEKKIAFDWLYRMRVAAIPIGALFIPMFVAPDSMMETIENTVYEVRGKRCHKNLADIDLNLVERIDQENAAPFHSP